MPPKTAKDQPFLSLLKAPNKRLHKSIHDTYKDAKKLYKTERGPKTILSLIWTQPINEAHHEHWVITCVHPNPPQEVIHKGFFDCLIHIFNVFKSSLILLLLNGQRSGFSTFLPLFPNKGSMPTQKNTPTNLCLDYPLNLKFQIKPCINVHKLIPHPAFSLKSENTFVSSMIFMGKVASLSLSSTGLKKLHGCSWIMTPVQMPRTLDNHLNNIK